MARLMRDGVFIGAKVHPDQKQKEELAKRIEIIEELIVEFGFQFHAHALRDLRVWGGNRPPAEEVTLAGITMAERKRRVEPAKIARLKKIRSFKDYETFVRDLALGEYILDCLRRSCAGIFDLDIQTPGCYYEIAILRQMNVPVLALSSKHEYSTTILGDPSDSVSVLVYKDMAEFKEFISNFLSDLAYVKTETRSINIKSVNMTRIKNEMIERGANFSNTLDAIVDEYFLNRGPFKELKAADNGEE